MRILRDLVEHRRMIAMRGYGQLNPAAFSHQMFRGINDGATSRKASLFLNDQRLGIDRLSHRATRHYADISVFKIVFKITSSVMFAVQSYLSCQRYSFSTTDCP